MSPRLFITIAAGFAMGLPGVAQTSKSTLDARDLYNAPERRADAKSLAPSSAETRNLGIRYNVLLIDEANGAAQPVDPDRTFKTGDCIVLDLQTNRSGYLYILAEEASHAWVALFPSDVESEDGNEVSAGVGTRAPAKTCLQFTDPPGMERMFLVLLQDPGDIKDVLRLYRLSSAATVPAASEDLVEQFRKEFASRDLKIKKIGQASATDAHPFTTYAVARDSRLSVEVDLRHK